MKDSAFSPVYDNQKHPFKWHNEDHIQNKKPRLEDNEEEKFMQNPAKEESKKKNFALKGEEELNKLEEKRKLRERQKEYGRIMRKKMQDNTIEVPQHQYYKQGRALRNEGKDMLKDMVANKIDRLAQFKEENSWGLTNDEEDKKVDSDDEDEDILRQYKTLSHQLRNYLLFDELPEDVDIPQEILNRQKLIRNNLITKVGYIVIDGKELVFKIIDNLNTQTLFVYDSAQEYY